VVRREGGIMKGYIDGVLMADTVAEQYTEIAALRRWKEDALIVLSRWDKVAEEFPDGKWGENKSELVLKRVIALKERVRGLEDDLSMLKIYHDVTINTESMREKTIKNMQAENAELRKALDRYKKYYVTRTSLNACESLRDEYALRIEMLSTPNTKEWLMARGYDGLYTKDCGCLIADLAPCGEGTDSCCPGYKQEEIPEGYDFFIGPSKAALGQKHTDPITRDWNTPEEDDAWEHLGQKEYNDLTSTPAEQKAFEDRCFERFDKITKEGV
jgi:hypothetical protein